MIGSGGKFSRRAAACWLAAASLVCCRGGAAADSAVPQNALRAAWAPSRDEAVIVDRLPVAAAGQAVGGIPDGSVAARRPRSLSRPYPGVAPHWTSEPVISQPLPAAATPTPAEGFPVLPGFEFEAGDLVAHEGLPCGDPHCVDCCGTWNSCGPVPIRCLLPRPPIDNLEFFGGVQGFTGPLNRGGTGSFGFHEGFNWGLPLVHCLAWQWGVTVTHSNFEGSSVTTDDRNQLFLTGGVFRRVDWGLQGGLVVDYLHDEWDFEADLVQLRGELSWVLPPCHEVGLWFTGGVNDATGLSIRRPLFDEEGVFLETQTASVEANDLFAFFYRRQFACGGQGRIFGGFTANDQGLLGGDVLLPINPCWTLRAGFLYLTPDSSNTANSLNLSEETWNVGISLVWTPCPRPLCGPNYCRPLLNVADNGSFATRLVR